MYTPQPISGVGFRVILGLYGGDNGKENGYYSIIGLYQVEQPTLKLRSRSPAVNWASLSRALSPMFARRPSMPLFQKGTHDSAGLQPGVLGVQGVSGVEGAVLYSSVCA